jgi:hypothetical protein
MSNLDSRGRTQTEESRTETVIMSGDTLCLDAVCKVSLTAAVASLVHKNHRSTKKCIASLIKLDRLESSRDISNRNSRELRSQENTMAEKVHKVGLVREAGYLYFIDKQGDISRSVMARGGKTSKKTATKKIKKTTKRR